MAALTDQYFERLENYKDKNRQRIYLKDIDCPAVWEDKLKEYIPDTYFYLNESTGEVGGPGAVNEPIPNSTGTRMGRGIAPAGDLMSSLPKDMRAENLMCYIGHEGTYTPAHREMCATLGHNIMVEASSTVGDEGKPERPGSSIWFMTETKDRHLVAEYWLSILGHDIEVESHFAQTVALKKAPFKVHVVEQKPGDLILIPPLAPHQVWNRGTRTMKVAWNRTTVETLEMAFTEALPNARLVCRDEQYKCKAIVYYTLQKYSTLVKAVLEGRQQSGEAALSFRYDKKMRQLQKDFKRLLIMYKTVILSETFNQDIPHERPEFVPFDSNITCSYCRGNIFNRFLTCPSCKDAFQTGTDEPYDICMECYAMGRSCWCISNLKWVEQWRWKDLCRGYEEWRKLYVLLNGGMAEGNLLTLQEERRFQTKKSLAHICQEQLRMRPWRDYLNPKAAEVENEEEEIVVNDDGTVRKATKKHSKAYLRTHHPCHVCLHRHPDWKMANCTQCGRYWCYGSLFRAHDLMPQTIMEDPRWICPHCYMRCSTGACRRDPRQHPHEPKGTLLGHDTRKVADARSVESLVDFSVSNLNWLKETTEAPTQNNRLDQRKEEAERAKQVEPSLDGDYVDDDNEMPDAQQLQGVANGDHSRIEFSPSTPNGTVDPSLLQQNNDPSRAAIDPALLNTPGAIYHSHTATDQLHASEPAMDAGYRGSTNQQVNGNEQTAEPYLYPDLDDGEESESQIPRKRAADDDFEADEQIKRTAKKKRKVAADDPDKKDAPSQSGALREYRKHQERKTLDEARKSGRYIQAWAALKGRSKVIKLRLSRQQLTDFRARYRNTSTRPSQKQTAGAQGDKPSAPTANDRILVRSDVSVAPVLPADPLLEPVPKQQHKPSKKQIRYRVEDDEDFGARRDRRPRKTFGHTNPSGKSRKPARRRYEEITIDSDEESERDEDNYDADATYAANARAEGNQRRMRAWLAKKQQQNDENLPSELPDDWKDGLAGRSRNRKPHSKDEQRKQRQSDGGTIADLNKDMDRMNGLGLSERERRQKKVRFSSAGMRPVSTDNGRNDRAVDRDESEGEDSGGYEDIDDDAGEQGNNGDITGAVQTPKPIPQVDGPAFIPVQTQLSAATGHSTTSHAPDRHKKPSATQLHEPHRLSQSNVTSSPTTSSSATPPSKTKQTPAQNGSQQNQQHPAKAQNLSAAALMAEENLRAKMMAAEWATDDGYAESDTYNHNHNNSNTNTKNDRSNPSNAIPPGNGTPNRSAHSQGDTPASNSTSPSTKPKGKPGRPRKSPVAVANTTKTNSVSPAAKASVRTVTTAAATATKPMSISSDPDSGSDSDSDSDGGVIPARRPGRPARVQ